ncbi:MAG: hypothetical protein A2902_00305 [Elusimicrobia bacterium RIFCSPLOWO2_01_FULL_64_13]|nr:MAG: hypothetical protein A2636_02960 [Elusimicrobia bacterium RIFCSPHIGHO2_01_FULL_64_10]OGR98009.1 MAG: hypothetical protein A2902_00305 [Elusimicrobia bacterium RIFCSPLOWO2_01_FULL_64_13]
MPADSPEEIFQKILQNVRLYLPDQPETPLRQAFEFSLRAHRAQTRAGGDPFITHPLEVARILSELHLDVPTMAAGILHDVLEDTPVTREEFLNAFGAEVTHIVEGVTKIDALESHMPGPGEETSSPKLVEQSENWRKMLIATAQDIRVILVKLADRTHNMETLDFLPPDKRRRIAEETLSLYVPMAQRLGMYQLKGRLADLSLKHLEPGIYAELEKKIGEREVRRKEFLDLCLERIEAILRPLGIPHRATARPKTLYSVYRKMVRQNKPFEEIQDLAALRLITDTIEHCYALLGAVHSHFAPLPDTFTDYIALPKNNLYQSLHTTVRIDRDQILEIQIRTEEMQRISEYGVAAHWRYKEAAQGRPGKDEFEDKLDWLKQILEWQQETRNPREFLEGLKTDLEFDQVFVFTPKGEVKKMPAGSTPVDFAYAVHTDLGHQCVGAKVNGKMVRLDTRLKSGDRCDILTRKGQHPHKDWLEFVRTPRARSKIRKFFRENPG